MLETGYTNCCDFYETYCNVHLPGYVLKPKTVLMKETHESGSKAVAVGILVVIVNVFGIF